MAAFLRKKFTLDTRHSTPQADKLTAHDQQQWSTGSPAARAAAAPPVYAKFATTQGRQTTGPPPRVVSGPMPLSNGQRRRTQSGAEHTLMRPQPAPDPNAFATARDDDLRYRPGPYQAPQPSAGYGPYGATAYSQPPQPEANPNIPQPRFDRTLQPSSRPLSTLVDKPLPLPKPDPTNGPINSSPPQPAASATRRTSAAVASSSRAPHVLMAAPPSTYSEKPLPQPQITPPAASPSRQPQQYFDAPQASTYRGPPVPVGDDLLPSAPMKHIPSYPLIAARVPVSNKNLPSQPRESPPTTTPSVPAYEPLIPPPVQQQPALPQTPHMHGNRHQRQAADVDDAYTHNSTGVPEPRPAPATEKPPPMALGPVSRTERPPPGPQSLDFNTHTNVSSRSLSCVSVALVSAQQRIRRDRP